MSYSALAFFTGLFGSIHCIGMCGPLAFAVPSVHAQRWLIIWDKLLYQFGRIISYSLMGILIGFIGKQLWLSGLQQTVSMLTGLLIIAAAGSRLLKKRFSKSAAWAAFNPVNKLLSYALNHKANHLITGILNGFLPCGFVYLALAGAVNAGGVLQAAQYMGWFGLGTVPLMLAAAISVNFATPLFRKRINQVIPYAMLCLGAWFILKGLTLDIPYLSPAKAADTVECR